MQAAHACELLVKARIAQEHPLLIFEHLPKISQDEPLLSSARLFESGRTYQFMDLPDRLWATTGILLPAISRYRSFGRLRNSIQHFAAPDDIDVGQDAVKFIYEAIDPFINQCWGLYAIDYNEDHEPHAYLMDALLAREVSFLVSAEAGNAWRAEGLTWPDVDENYLDMMKARIKDAGR